MEDLRIKLQYFAEEDVVDTDTADTESAEDGVGEQTETTENVTSADPDNAKKQTEKLFTQAELDEKITKRMAREKGASALLEKLAKRQGVSVDDFVKNVESAISEQEVNTYSKEKGISQDLAQEIMQMKQELADTKEINQKLAKEKELQDEWKAFSTEFPNVKPEDIPKEVLDQASKGTKLVDAYSRYEYKRLVSTQDDVKKNAIKEYLEGKLKYEPVEGSGATVVTTSSKPKTFDDARKQALEFLKNSKEFKV